MRPALTFDPDRVAHLEAAGWRAYYDRAWLRLLGLIVRLSQEQFSIPFPISLLAAYHVTRGAIAWAPVEHDVQAVTRAYERFYRLARRYSGLQFDPRRAAADEIAYWEAHRRLSGQPEKREFVEAMVRLHSTLFGLSAEEARQSAEQRVLANNTVDLITSGQSRDMEADWVRIEDYLRRCYRSIRAALVAGEAAAG